MAGKARGQRGNTGTTSTAGNPPGMKAGLNVSLFPTTRYGIYNGTLVEVLGQTDIPGMSPALWIVNAISGVQEVVPVAQCRHFATAGQALQALQILKGTV